MASWVAHFYGLTEHEWVRLSPEDQRAIVYGTVCCACCGSPGRLGWDLVLAGTSWGRRPVCRNQTACWHRWDRANGYAPELDPVIA